MDDFKRFKEFADWSLFDLDRDPFVVGDCFFLELEMNG